jgi:lysozyme
MQPSENCFQVTRWSEGLELKAYPDPASKDGTPWTIGRGHTKGVKRGDTCTVQQADQWLREDLLDAANIVKRHVSGELTQGQFDCLCDMAFNLGGGFIAKDGVVGDFDDLVRNKDIAAIRRHIPDFRLAGGKVQGGLVKRGGARVALFDGDDYTTAMRKGEESLAKYRAGK